MPAPGTPARRGQIALEDLRRRHAEHLRADDAEHGARSRRRRSPRSAPARCGREVAEQPAQRALEVLGLLHRHAEAAHRAGGRRCAGGVAPAAAAGRRVRRSCDLLERHLRRDDLAIDLARLRAARRACRCRPPGRRRGRRCDRRSSRCRCAATTMKTVASAVSLRSAARSLASVAKSSAEKLSSKT